MPWLQVGNQGAEYAALKRQDKDRDIKLGERFEISCTNLDMSTNCLTGTMWLLVSKIVDVWPIMGRSGAAQR